MLSAGHGARAASCAEDTSVPLQAAERPSPVAVPAQAPTSTERQHLAAPPRVQSHECEWRPLLAKHRGPLLLPLAVCPLRKPPATRSGQQGLHATPSWAPSCLPSPPPCSLGRSPGTSLVVTTTTPTSAQQEPRDRAQEALPEPVQESPRRSRGSGHPRHRPPGCRTTAVLLPPSPELLGATFLSKLNILALQFLRPRLALTIAPRVST